MTYVQAVMWLRRERQVLAETERLNVTEAIKPIRLRNLSFSR